jgi:hypothetical protein
MGMMDKCTYCEAVAEFPRHVKPLMCGWHHAIIVLMARARQLNLVVNCANLTELLAQANGKLPIMAADIPQLLRDVQ